MNPTKWHRCAFENADGNRCGNAFRSDYAKKRDGWQFREQKFYCPEHGVNERLEAK